MRAVAARVKAKKRSLEPERMGILQQLAGIWGSKRPFEESKRRVTFAIDEDDSDDDYKAEGDTAGPSFDAGL